METREVSHSVSESKFKLPNTLTVKDLITIVSVAVSLAVAWGVFSTRLTLLEKETITLSERIKQTEMDMSSVRSSIRRLEQQQQYDELYIDRLYEEMKKTPPRRPSMR